MSFTKLPTKLPTVLGAGVRPLGATPAAMQAHRTIHQTSPTGHPRRQDSGDGDSSKNSVPQPKISNLSVPGVDGQDKLTKEQKKEVRQHNKEFEEKHDSATRAPDDKVDKKFWSR